jgi:hypothetical protein
LSAQAQAGPAAEGLGRPLQLAVGPHDPDGSPPSCGLDGVCRVNECRSNPDPDPDCPGGLPRDPVGPPNRFQSRPSDIHDCTSQETAEMAAAIDWGAENWVEYKAALEEIRDWPVSIGNCLEERFQRNGKAVCESSTGGNCTFKGEPANAWASPFNRRSHLCPGFLGRVRALPGATTRQACYFAIVTHEWGHTCERGHKVLEIIDDEAFLFWKAKHPEVTIDFGRGGCGLG